MVAGSSWADLATAALSRGLPAYLASGWRLPARCRSFQCSFPDACPGHDGGHHIKGCTGESPSGPPWRHELGSGGGQMEVQALKAVLQVRSGDGRVGAQPGLP